jgi:hypothetical protein
MANNLEVVGISGPFGKKASGKFDSQGEPVMKKCPPYWVVRVLHGTVLQDHRRGSAKAASDFAEAIRSGRIVEQFISGGFRLVETAS